MITFFPPQRGIDMRRDDLRYDNLVRLVQSAPICLYYFWFFSAYMIDQNKGDAWWLVSDESHPVIPAATK